MENNSLAKYDRKQLQKVSDVIAVTYKLLTPLENQLIPYRKGDKWGFSTFDKIIVIECIYDWVQLFNDERSIVEQNEKYGIIAYVRDN
jgi:hypothetical protein